MKAELILDEDSLKDVLKVYMRHKVQSGTLRMDTVIHPENITIVQIIPEVKSIKVFFEYEPKD